jgi:sodium transport system permease protein
MRPRNCAIGSAFSTTEVSSLKGRSEIFSDVMTSPIWNRSLSRLQEENMSLRNALIVYRKELKDCLRDRRTIKSMIVVPIFVFPLVTIGMSYLSNHFVGQARREIPRTMIIGGEQSPKVMAELREFKDIEIVPARADYTAELGNKKTRVAVEVPQDFDALLDRGEQAHISIYYRKEDITSRFAADTVEKFFKDLRDETARKALVVHNLPVEVLEPIVVDRQNVTPIASAAGSVLGKLLPYFIIILCLSGATTPAIDLTAGEKERGTMETILCSPVSRTDLVGGKFLLVLTTSLTTAVLAITSMSLSCIYAQKLIPAFSGGGVSPLPAGLAVRSIVAVFAMVLPLSVLFSGALLALALFAKTFREGQSYVAPLMVIIALPAATSFLPGVELNLKTIFIPILNTSLVSKEILAGTYHWGFIILIFVTSCVYASVAMSYAVRLFNDEKVLFRA